jgi:hypothetical protein
MRLWLVSICRYEGLAVTGLITDSSVKHSMPILATVGVQEGVGEEDRI